MIGFRRTIAALIVLSLAIVPAGADAYAAGMAAAEASHSWDCSPCPMAHDTNTGTMTEMSKASECPDTDGKRGNMTPATCAVFCGGLVALPSASVEVLEEAPAKLLGSRIEVTLAAHIDPPDPYPPKR